jgi:hypothetical protein
MSSQILSGAKSMSILAPTVEENPLEDRLEKPSLKCDHNIIQNALHFHERDSIKATQSTQTFHTARSEQPPDKPNQNGATILPVETRVRLVNEDFVCTELQTRHLTSIPDEGEANMDAPQEELEEQVSSRQGTKAISVDTDDLPWLENRASPSPGRQNQHREMWEQSRATLASLESSNKAQPNFIASPQVPTGIVSSLLRGIPASDPDCEPPSGFRRLWKSRQTASPPPDREPSTPMGGSNMVGSYTKDPLAGVSHEEDIASLASLAEVIQTQDDILYSSSPSKEELIKPSDTPFKVIRPRAGNIPSVGSVSELPVGEPSWKTTDLEPLAVSLKVTSTTSPGDIDKALATPRRSATESSIVGRSRGSSVKVLAARFNNAGTNVRQSTSPIITPDSRRFRNSPVERAVVSPYTVNTSPIPMTLTLRGPSRSFRATHNEIVVHGHTVVSPNKVKGTASSLLQKPFFTNSHPQGNHGPPQWPKLRPVNRSPRPDSGVVQNEDCSIVPLPHSSSLHRTGDGNFSFTIPPKSSLGTVLPRPEEPLVDEFMDLSRPSATRPDNYSSSLSFSTPSRDIFGGMSNSEFVGQKPGSHGTSILYSQIQHLYRQLKAKEEEAEDLRRQLMTKDSLNDLGTLSQHLRQAKRDSAVWRGRAEIAEKRLEMLCHISQPERHSTVADEQPAPEMMGSRGSRGIEERGQFHDWTRNSTNESDGIYNDRKFPASEGTVHRATSEQWHESQLE